MKTYRNILAAFTLIVIAIALVTVSVMPVNALTQTNAPMIVVNSTSSSYGCTLVAQTPSDWVYMVKRQSFDAYWTVKNSGSAVWYSSSTKFAYIGGTKMQTKGDSFQISSNVGRGGKIKLGVDMIAPKTPGTYSTTWALISGNTQVCRVTLTLTVKR